MFYNIWDGKLNHQDYCYCNVLIYYLISESNQCMALQDAGLARAKPSNWELMGRWEKLIAIIETTGYWRYGCLAHCSNITANIVILTFVSSQEEGDKWWCDQQVENVIIITTLANDLLLQNIFWRKGWMNLCVFCTERNSRNQSHCYSYSGLSTGIEINWLVVRGRLGWIFLCDNQYIY